MVEHVLPVEIYNMYITSLYACGADGTRGPALLLACPSPSSKETEIFVWCRESGDNDMDRASLLMAIVPL